VQKCKYLAEAFRANQVETDTIFYADNGLILNELEPINTTLSTKKGSLGHLISYFFRADLQVLAHCSEHRYDLLYIRHMPTHPAFLRFLKKLKKVNPKIKVLIEFPTWPYDTEMTGLKNQLVLRIDRMYRSNFHLYTDYVVTNTDAQTILKIPCLHMTNGISSAQIPLEVPELRELDGRPMQLLFVGNISKWHGLDRVIRGLKGHTATEVHLDIIGEGSEKSVLVSLSESLNLHEVIHFHAAKTGKELHKYYAESDLAIGSLGLHRIGLDAGVPLKHREYCAHALPFVYSCNDSDFALAAFALKTTADENWINFEELRAFLQKIYKQKPGFKTDMQTFAYKHLTWEWRVKALLGELDQ
jgi:glycosyltransferase involved in cell wall biosynthesis